MPWTCAAHSHSADQILRRAQEPAASAALVGRAASASAALATRLDAVAIPRRRRRARRTGDPGSGRGARRAPRCGRATPCCSRSRAFRNSSTARVRVERRRRRRAVDDQRLPVAPACANSRRCWRWRRCCEVTLSAFWATARPLSAFERTALSDIVGSSAAAVERERDHPRAGAVGGSAGRAIAAPALAPPCQALADRLDTASTTRGTAAAGRRWPGRPPGTRAWPAPAARAGSGSARHRVRRLAQPAQLQPRRRSASAAFSACSSCSRAEPHARAAARSRRASPPAAGASGSAARRRRRSAARHAASCAREHLAQHGVGDADAAAAADELGVLVVQHRGERIVLAAAQQARRR